MKIDILPIDYVDSNFSSPSLCAVARALKRHGFHANVYCRNLSEGQFWGELCFFGRVRDIIPMTSEEASLVNREREFRTTGYSIDFVNLKERITL